eukprot:GHVS01012700.1.p1 GENE.GHVS01012700.1~~GHVS01012700.1.p1  ORF type:complete len:207 (+),score=33.02 GHVS01012700.1:78-698(+)
MVDSKDSKKPSSAQQAFSADDLIQRLQSLVEDEKKLRLGKKTGPIPTRVLVVGVDASTYSRDAVKWAREYGYICPSDIVVLATVWEEAIMQYMATADMGLYAGLVSLHHSEIKQHNEEALKSARMMLKDFYKELLGDCDVFPLIVSTTTSSKSAVGDVMVKTAEALHADSIIVGCHGHGAFKRFFLGSVSKYVVDHAQCPVLVVKR